jgi:hypothetical protein
MCEHSDKEARRNIPLRDQAHEKGLMSLSEIGRELGESSASLYHWFKCFRRYIGEPKADSLYMWFRPEQAARFRELSRLLRVELYTIEGAKRQLRLAAEREKATAAE